MRKNFLKCLEKLNILPQNEYLIVAVSGGADSMALLDFINFIKAEKKITLIAAHVNHMLRKKESDKDEKFVKNWCKSNKIEFKYKKIDTKKIAESKKLSIEDAARKIRYDFFLELSLKFNAKIATAHTLSDNVETFLMNLAKGAGGKGLSAIPIKRDKIIRPFLFLKRKEIEKYCKEYNIKFVTDSSNFSCRHTRNKIRLKIIPEFKKINPLFENSVQNTIEKIKEDDKHLTNLAKEELEKSRTTNGILIKEMPKPITSRIIILAIKEFFNVNLNNSSINQILNILKKNNGCCNLNNKNELIIENRILKKYKSKNLKNWQKPFDNSSFLTPDKTRIIINTLNNFVGKNSKFFLDANKVSESTFRNRRPGDFFLKKGRHISKSIKKFFNEEKVPISKRSSLVLLARGSEVLWIEGFGVSENASLDKNSKKIIEIIIKRENQC